MAFVAASIAALAFVLSWPDSTSAPITDLEVVKTLQYFGASEQQILSGIKAIDESLIAERAQLNMLADQSAALGKRLSNLENSATCENPKLEEQLKTIQAQMIQENASIAEQVRQVATANASVAQRVKESQEDVVGVMVKPSEGTLRPTPLPLPRPAFAQKRKPAAPLQARTQPGPYTAALSSLSTLRAGISRASPGSTR